MHLMDTELVVQLPLPDLARQAFLASSFLQPGRMLVRCVGFSPHFADGANILATDWHYR